MRLSLFILGVFASVVCIEIAAEAQKRWVVRLLRSWLEWIQELAGSRHSSNAWPMCAVLAGTAHPVRTSSGSRFRRYGRGYP